MAALADFRLSQFDHNSVGKCGKYIGRQSYWKLYAIENFFRVVIHSVLSIQIRSDWWNIAVDETIRNKVERFQSNYLKKVWHGRPGTHGIYYVDLKDLNEIMRADSNLFDPVIPDLDKWIVGIEELRLPRNVIAHMNFPSKTDVKRIEVFYDDCLELVSLIQNKVELRIP